MANKSALYLMGCGCLAGVVILWIFSSAVIQGVYDDYDKPSIITYLSSSVFTMYLPIYYLYHACLSRLRSKQDNRGEHRDGDCSSSNTRHTHHSSTINSTQHTQIQYRANHNHLEDGYNSASALLSGTRERGYISPTPHTHNSINDSPALLDGETFQHYHDHDDAKDHSGDVSDDLVSLSDYLPFTMGTASVGNRKKYRNSPDRRGSCLERLQKSLFWYNFKYALLFGPLWFAMNFTFNTALKLTSVSVNTILATTSSFFVVIFSFLFLRTRIRPLHLLAVVLAVSGAAVVVVFSSKTDSKDTDGKTAAHVMLNTVVDWCSTSLSPATEDASAMDGSLGARITFKSILGSLVALFSAALYGSYSVALEYVTNGTREGYRCCRKPRLSRNHTQQIRSNDDDETQEHIPLVSSRSDTDHTHALHGDGHSPSLSIDSNHADLTRPILGDHQDSVAILFNHSDLDDHHNAHNRGADGHTSSPQGLGAQDCQQHRDEEEPYITTALLFGSVGLVTMVFGVPMLYIFHLTGLEPFELPERHVVKWLVVNAFLGASLSDFLWANGVVLTSPFVASISMTFSIPLALGYDLITKKTSFNIFIILGSLCIILSVIAVTLSQYWDVKKQQQQQQQDNDDNNHSSGQTMTNTEQKDPVHDADAAAGHPQSQEPISPLNGKEARGKPPHRRPTAMVLQHDQPIELFPTVSSYNSSHEPATVSQDHIAGRLSSGSTHHQQYLANYDDEELVSSYVDPRPNLSVEPPSRQSSGGDRQGKHSQSSRVSGSNDPSHQIQHNNPHNSDDDGSVYSVHLDGIPSRSSATPRPPSVDTPDSSPLLPTLDQSHLLAMYDDHPVDFAPLNHQHSSRPNASGGEPVIWTRPTSASVSGGQSALGNTTRQPPSAKPGGNMRQSSQTRTRSGSTRHREYALSKQQNRQYTSVPVSRPPSAPVGPPAVVIHETYVMPPPSNAISMAVPGIPSGSAIPMSIDDTHDGLLQHMGSLDQTAQEKMHALNDFIESQRAQRVHQNRS